MDDTVKTVGTIVGVGAGAFIGWKLYKKLFPSGTDTADKEESVANTEIVQKNKALLKQYEKIKKPTYTDGYYKGWAETLYKAMDGFGNGYAKVLNVFSHLQSDTDVAKLIDAFGIKNKKTNNPFSSSATPLSLIGWIADEMDQAEIFGINKQFSNKKIGFRF